MKTTNNLIDRGMFVVTWLTIVSVSLALVSVFVVGLKTIFGL
ncbi:hypothetical protein [Urechidicola sp. KH5]